MNNINIKEKLLCILLVVCYKFLSNISIVRKIPVSNADEINQGLATFHYKEIRKLHSSGKHRAVRVIQSRRKRRMLHAASMGNMTYTYKLSGG
jgi:hypothetical protein